jgi:uncharacterized membrane protein YhiD involved in acid resistance
MESFNNLFEAQQFLSALDNMAKLGIGVVLAGLIGYERERHGRPAGLRTHILLILGVILFSEVSRAFDPNEPARIAAQIVTGVGFLCAGTILRIGAEVKGLTTSGSLFAVSGIGMAVSAGGAFIWVAVASTILTLITLSVLDKLEAKLAPFAHPRNMQIELESLSFLQGLVDTLGEKGTVQGVKINSRSEPCSIAVDVQGESNTLLSAASSADGVKMAHWMD